MSPDVEKVLSQRRSAFANGYEPVRVKSGDKVPVGKGWTNGETLELLLNADPSSLNTGILARGLRPIDIDVEDPGRVQKILALAKQHLSGPAILRQRANSARVTLIYRADQGAPRKLSVTGKHGKVEALGDGQQVVVFGTHPTGAELTWARNKSPATCPKDGLGKITEMQVAEFLEACLEVLEPDVTHEGKISRTQAVSGVDNSDLGSGIESSPWFNGLSPSHMAEVVAKCLSCLDNRTFDPRDTWLKVLFAVSDAEHRGCPGARRMALEWAKQGANWTSESDFDVAWNSAYPGKLSVGTLLYFAQKAGADLSPWYASAASAVNSQPPNTKILRVGDVPETPAKREWLHGSDVIRGAVTMLAAPGAKGKSSWLIMLAIAAASGQNLLGTHVFGGPLRVLYINAEDASAEIALRLRAALLHHKLADSAVTGLGFAGTEIDLTLLEQEKQSIRVHEAGFAKLEKMLDAEQPDIVIIDPLVSVMGGVSLNDNAGAAVLMKALVQIAAERRIGIVLAHHTSKGRDTGTADAAMGAASFVNLARIVLSIESLKEDECLKLGYPSASIFRVGRPKQNLSAKSVEDRLFRLVSVEVPNAKPPVYPHGDRVGVVEAFTPAVASPMPQAALDAAIACIAASKPPLSPNPRNVDALCSAVAAAISPALGRTVSQTETIAVINQLRLSGRVVVRRVSIGRKGRSGYERNGLVVANTY